MTIEHFNEVLELGHKMRPWQNLHQSMLAVHSVEINGIVFNDDELKDALQELVRQKLKSFIEKSKAL